jgi:hypothetical protein
VTCQSNQPRFRAEAPGAIASIDVDEGSGSLSNLIAVAWPDLSLISRRIAIDSEPLDEVSIPLFRLV